MKVVSLVDFGDKVLSLLKMVVLVSWVKVWLMLGRG